MLINKESFKKYAENKAVLADLENFSKGHKFQEVDDFIKTHKELPEVHFLNAKIGSDTIPFLVVRETKTQIRAMAVTVFTISGTAEMKDLKYAYMVDVDFYEEQKFFKFQGCAKIIKNSNGTFNLAKVKEIHLYKSLQPLYFQDVEF